jgi:Uma2 family endonuclease
MTTEIELQAEEEIEELATGENGEIAVLLTVALENYVYNNQLGWMFDGRTTFEMKPGLAKREPDLSFVAAGRLPNRVRDILKLAPDLAVEIVSPSDMLFDVEEKVLQYLQSGVRLVRPVVQAVDVYRPEAHKPNTLGIDDELDGEDVIPGFKLKISALF